MTKNIVLLFMTIVIFCFQINGQGDKDISVKLIKDKPSVFITFERKGKQAPIFEGENKNRIWLKLHNNTKLKIFLSEFSVDKEYGDVGLYYDVEQVYYFEDKSIKVPLGYGGADVCNVFTLLSGKAASFSIPEEHLGKGLAIRTKFYYGWTGDWKEDIYEGTTHIVSFGNSELPR